MVFTEKVRRSTGSGTSRIRDPLPVPALLMRTLGVPWVERMVWAASWMLSREVMSVVWKCALGAASNRHQLI